MNTGSQCHWWEGREPLLWSHRGDGQKPRRASIMYSKSPIAQRSAVDSVKAEWDKSTEDVDSVWKRFFFVGLSWDFIPQRKPCVFIRPFQWLQTNTWKLVICFWNKTKVACLRFNHKTQWLFHAAPETSVLFLVKTKPRRYFSRYDLQMSIENF